MFQLRLWLTVALIVVAGGLVFLLGTSGVSDLVLAPMDAGTTQAAAAVRAQVMLHGANAVDAAARAAVHPAVLAAVQKGAMAPDAEAALLAANGQAAPAFAVLLNPNAGLLMRAGTDPKLELPMTGSPLFAEAKAGVARDGLLTLADVPHHVAAAPVYNGGDVAAVVLLGWPYADAAADALAQASGTSLVLVSGEHRIGTAFPDLKPADLTAATVGQLDVAPLPNKFPLLLEPRGRYVVTRVPLFGKEADLDAVVIVDQNPPMRAIAFAQAMVLAGTLILALFQSLVIVFTMRSVRRPINVIMDHLAQYQQSGIVGILPEASLSGPFVRLGKQVNMILQMIPSAARTGLTGNLGGSFGGGLSAPSLSGMLSNDKPAFSNAPQATSTPLPSAPPAPPPSKPASPPVAAPSAVALPGAGLSAVAPAAGAAPSALASLFDDQAPDPLAAFRVAGKSTPPPAPPPAPTLPPRAVPEPAPAFADDPEADEGAKPDATVMFNVPKELIQQSAAHQAAARPAPLFPENEEGRTVVAQVPADLLSSSGRKAADPEEIHFREVYNRFVEVRVECGEDTSDLTYERFVTKLQKNRQQILEKHKAKTVRFQVYVKEGKAALRALPVRE